MATLTSLGVGSGLDLNGLVTQLVALERRPLSLMQAKANRLQSQVSSFGKVSGYFGALQTAANKLNDSTLWSRTSATVSDPAVVAAAVGSNATAGSYALTVQALARGQTLASGTALASSGDTVGSGTLTLELGKWNATQSSFAPKDGSTAVTLTIGAGDTLQTLRDKINSAGAGVSASLITDASGVRLALRSTTTGEENGFRIGVADDDGQVADGTGLSRFAYDPAAGSGSLQLSQSANDARATINGVEIVSATNQVSGVVDGLTLNLNRESATEVAITVTADKTAISDAIKGFASAYNDLARYLADQTKYDSATKVAGLL
ncbi:MAG: flagellar filament capping protein FliD, partial [Rubrivivax sp.]